VELTPSQLFLLTVTTENSTILSWVNSLTASGGGDCPEDVLGGIQSSINALSSYPDNSKTLIVVTDASAQPGDVDSIIAAAQANNVQVNVLLTGDCGAPSAAFASSELQAVDDTDPNPRVELVGVKSTEPFDGQGDGSTENDIHITADGRIFMQSERSGSGNERIYTVTYKATDASGNFAFGSATITIPHDQR
jgi:hypothetical protein